MLLNATIAGIDFHTDISKGVYRFLFVFSSSSSSSSSYFCRLDWGIFVSCFFSLSFSLTRRWHRHKSERRRICCKKKKPTPTTVSCAPQPTNQPPTHPFTSIPFGASLALVKHRSNKRKRPGPPPMQSNNTVRKTRKNGREVGAGSDEEEVERRKGERDRPPPPPPPSPLMQDKPGNGSFVSIFFFSREKRNNSKKKVPFPYDEDIISNTRSVCVVCVVVFIVTDWN